MRHGATLKRVLLAVLVAVVIVLQVSLLPALRPFGVVPNLALVFVVLVGLESAASTAVVVAVVCGLALDLSSGTNLGLWTGVLVLAALVTGVVHRSGIESDGPLVPSVIVAGGTCLVPLVVLSGLVTVVARWPIGLLGARLMTELVLNLVIMLALRPLVRRVTPSLPPDLAVVE